MSIKLASMKHYIVDTITMTSIWNRLNHRFTTEVNILVRLQHWVAWFCIRQSL